MKIKVKYPLPLLVALITLGSCYYDKEDLLYPPVTSTSTCDTVTATSYSQKVVPLFQQYCYSCHSGGSPSAGIQMGDYNSDKAIATGGRLLGTLNHQSGYSAMPQNAAKLSDCQIAIIKQWMDAGTPNN